MKSLIALLSLLVVTAMPLSTSAAEFPPPLPRGAMTIRDVPKGLSPNTHGHYFEAAKLQADTMWRLAGQKYGFLKKAMLGKEYACLKDGIYLLILEINMGLSPENKAVQESHKSAADDVRKRLRDNKLCDDDDDDQNRGAQLLKDYKRAITSKTGDDVLNKNAFQNAGFVRSCCALA